MVRLGESIAAVQAWYSKIYAAIDMSAMPGPRPQNPVSR